MDAFATMPPAPLEAALAAAEAALGVTITVRDLTGWLRGDDGKPLIAKERESHKRLAVCRAGFAPACIAHCRHGATAGLRAATEPLAHTCWKNVREVLVPVARDGTLHGFLFAGAWRGEGPTPAGAWAAAWRRLPAWDPGRGGAVAAALALLADGLWDAAARARTAPSVDDRAGRIRAFVRANLARGVGRDGLARHLGLSPSRTSHAVRQACGVSLQELVMGERLAAARRLLSEGHEAVSAVGARVGWSDPPHFSRVFRRLAGLSPGAWRERHRLA